MYEPPYKITNEILMLISEIMNKIGSIQNYEELNRLPRLRKQNRIKSIYSSCSIEANSLTIEQVKDVINGKNVIGPQKDIIEVKNAITAYDNLGSFNPFSQKDLLKCHGILSKDVVFPSGSYRTTGEGVYDGERIIHIALPASMVPENMNNLFEWINNNKKVIHPLILSSIFHYEFVFIHPFSDGNGRTARLWQTALLGEYYPIFYWISIENYIMSNQSDYYKSIDDSSKEGESTKFITFMLKMIDKALDELKRNVNNGNINIYVKKLLNVMPDDTYLTANEILDLLNLKSKITLRKNYLNPAIDSGFIQQEFPDKPTSRNQRYIKK